MVSGVDLAYWNGKRWAWTNSTHRVAVPQRRRYGTTLMPIDLQVPIRDFIMPCMGTSTFISSSALTTAISYRARSDICGCSFPASFSLPGLLRPFSTPAARLIKKVAGGVRVSKAKERSSKAVSVTGMGTLSSIFAVFALNSLQKPMMFTPAWPRAGPTGGAGFAWPAPMVRRTMAFTLLLMLCEPFEQRAGGAGKGSAL
mmetsp:Transcript_11149/g.40877  ORF Transcript_11149/g.40877 Transcript_11149/m.40877 type:complete len:200 (+) Transcript_11149:1096-1695(+)